MSESLQAFSSIWYQNFSTVIITIMQKLLFLELLESNHRNVQSYKKVFARMVYEFQFFHL